MLLALALSIGSVPLDHSVSTPAVSAAALSVAPVSAAAVVRDSRDDETQPEYPELGMKLDLGIFEAFAPEKSARNPRCLGDWNGRMANSDVHILFFVLDSADYGFAEPEDVVRTWRDTMLDSRDKDSEAQHSSFSFEPTRSLPGAFGAAPWLAITRAAVQSKDQPEIKSSRFLLAGLLPDKGWSLQVDVTPPLEKAADSELQTFLEKCAHYDGKPRDSEWSSADAETFWAHMAPASTMKAYQKPVRTEHYIVLSDSPHAAEFAKKIEGHYAAVKRVLPIDELKGRRLLPVLLFRTGEEYRQFYVQLEKLDPNAKVYEQGSAAGSWYATSIEYRDEEDQLWYLSKQLMVNRARCWGACFWFRSGLRTYIMGNTSERQASKNSIKKGRYTPLEKLLENADWGESSPKKGHKGAAEGLDNWNQSALWIEFLHESPALKDKFRKFVQDVGAIHDGDVEKVVATLQSIYGMDLPALQAKWIEHFKKLP